LKLVVFGLTISSSWGNGHATLWRGLCRALARRGHRVTFFERDVAYYAAHRDLQSLEGVDLRLYGDWSEIARAAEAETRSADVAMVTSYCPDAIDATRLVTESARLSVFYDMDAPMTLERLQAGLAVAYVGARGFRDFDLVLSYTGGVTLNELRVWLGARRVAPLYGSVDPDSHRPMPPAPQYSAHLSFLGTYAADRQAALERLFVNAARARPDCRFVIGGAQYPEAFPWTENIYFVQHLPPGEHPAFFCSSPMTMNVTRPAFATRGYCPSGRLFEAAACGAAIVSDEWVGLSTFFTPGSEILLARDTNDVLAAVALDSEEARRIGERARERVLDEHTAERRASELELLLASATNRRAEIEHLPQRSSRADHTNLEL